MKTYFLAAFLLLSAALCVHDVCAQDANGAHGFPVPNSPTAGTQLGSLAVIDKTTGYARTATTADTAVPVYIVLANAGVSGNASLGFLGNAPCAAYDATSTTTLGEYYVINSTTNNGYCHSQALTSPPAGGTGMAGYLAVRSQPTARRSGSVTRPRQRTWARMPAAAGSRRKSFVPTTGAPIHG